MFKLYSWEWLSTEFREEGFQICWMCHNERSDRLLCNFKVMVRYLGDMNNTEVLHLWASSGLHKHCIF